MTDPIVEFAKIQLAPGCTEADLLAASETFQTDFLNGQEGFLRRDMVRKADGIYLDVILWQSRAHADAAFERAQNSDAAGNYFQQMQFDPEDTDAKPEYFPLVASSGT